MVLIRPLSLIFAIGLLYGCADTNAGRLAELGLGERLPGGDTTNTRLLGSNSYLLPASNLSIERQLEFYGGNGFFNQGWVEAPASTDARDGLGPLFNARSCSGCHFKDGKGEVPDENDEFFVGLLVRLHTFDDETLLPDSTYGGQIQDQSIPGVPKEAKVNVQWSINEGLYPDGKAYELREPSFTLSDFNYGVPSSSLILSPRLAPHMVGLGLLEAIPTSSLEDLSDPNDEDEDGISGRIHWVDTTQGVQAGRFGWRAESPTVKDQVASAFVGDMGLTTSLAPQDTCTDSQEECLDSPTGGEPEVSDRILGRVVTYSKTIAVPVRRNPEDAQVLRGKSLFKRVKCSTCHVPSYITGESDIAALSGQVIWPYTDLLLHDMGPDLADISANDHELIREWRTAPLWGIGMAKAVSEKIGYLHDGRARNIEEAILWHGGEAKESRDQFMHLSVSERAALVAFVSDL